MFTRSKTKPWCDNALSRWCYDVGNQNWFTAVVMAFIVLNTVLLIANTVLLIANTVLLIATPRLVTVCTVVAYVVTTSVVVAYVVISYVLMAYMLMAYVPIGLRSFVSSWSVSLWPMWATRTGSRRS